MDSLGELLTVQLTPLQNACLLQYVSHPVLVPELQLYGGVQGGIAEEAIELISEERHPETSSPPPG